MLNALLALIVFAILLGLFWGSVVVGRRYGLKHISRHAEHKLEIVSVAEAAIFGLLGLLIAFTFSGAYDRFEHRKMHRFEEANAYELAYMRMDLLNPKARTNLHHDIAAYLDLRIAAFKAIPHFAEVRRDIEASKKIQKKIWAEAITACGSNSTLGQLVLPPLNAMFEVANEGMGLTTIHPPALIFILLIGLAMMGGFLAGYTTAESKGGRSLYLLSYVLLTAFTIYLIVDLEFPRVGLIRVDAFDQVLLDARHEMT